MHPVEACEQWSRRSKRFLKRNTERADKIGSRRRVRQSLDGFLVAGQDGSREGEAKQ